MASEPSDAQRVPWTEAGDIPLPASAQSVQILNRDEPLFVRPTSEAKPRGSALKGARLPLYAARRGPGCRGRWLMVGPVAWVCEDRVELSQRPAWKPQVPSPATSDGLPFRYFFAGRDGTFGYAELALAEEGIPDAQLEPGFAVAVVRIADRRGGDPFGLTSRGLWIPMRDLIPARRVEFSGQPLEDGSLAVAWVHNTSAPVYESPGGRRAHAPPRSQFDRLIVLETAKRGPHRWFRVGERQWVSDRHVRAPTAASTPGGLRPGERWIDVDTKNQIATAYEGERPVFATLVSTGRGPGNSVLATPKGQFRIWVKLLASDMDNLEDPEANRLYAIQDVPWVMYFKRGYGLHGTFWHQRFGNVQSHGCVNLAPLDAERLFHWSRPRLPAGWSAVLPTHYERGTLVRVR